MIMAAAAIANACFHCRQSIKAGACVEHATQRPEHVRDCASNCLPLNPNC